MDYWIAEAKKLYLVNNPYKEYFIYIFNGQFRGIKGAWESDGSNKNQYFLD